MLRQNNNEKLRPNATQIYGWPFRATKDPVWPLDHTIFLFAFRQKSFLAFLIVFIPSSVKHYIILTTLSDLLSNKLLLKLSLYKQPLREFNINSLHNFPQVNLHHIIQVPSLIS